MIAGLMIRSWRSLSRQGNIVTLEPRREKVVARQRVREEEVRGLATIMTEGSVARFASAIASAVQLGRDIDLQGQVEELKEKKAAAEQSLAELQEKICFYKKDISQLEELERVKGLLSPSSLDNEIQKQRQDTGTIEEKSQESLKALTNTAHDAGRTPSGSKRTREGSNGSRDEPSPRKSKSIVQEQKQSEETVTIQEEVGYGSTPKKKQNTIHLKDHIVTVLEEAGAMGLSCLSTTDIVEWVVQKELWDWPTLESGRGSVRRTCDTYPLIFVRVSPGNYGLKSLQQGKTPQGSLKTLTKEKAEKKKTKKKTNHLKNHIVTVLEEADQEMGLACLTVSDIAEFIVQKELWDWPNLESGLKSVRSTCDTYPLIFVRVFPGTYGLKSLQQGKSSRESSKTLTTRAHVKRPSINDRKRTRAAANGSTDESAPKKSKSIMQRQETESIQTEAPAKVKLTLKDHIITVLKKAGEKGSTSLTTKRMAELIVESGLYSWAREETGPQSVRYACDQNPAIFFRVSTGVYGLKSSQQGKSQGESSKALTQEKAHLERNLSGSKKTKAIASANGSRDESSPNNKNKEPMTQKDAIVTVLEEAGANGLTCLPVSDILELLKEKKLLDLHLKCRKHAYSTVSGVCRKAPDVFVKHAPGIFGLKSLQPGKNNHHQGSSKALAEQEAHAKKKVSSGSERPSEVISGSRHESIQKEQQRVAKECVDEPQSLEAEDRRLLLALLQTLKTRGLAL